MPPLADFENILWPTLRRLQISKALFSYQEKQKRGVSSGMETILQATLDCKLILEVEVISHENKLTSTKPLWFFQLPDGRLFALNSKT